MAHSTRDLLDRFLEDLANADPKPSKGSMYGYRSLAKRFATHCPKAPVPMTGMKKYLDDTGEATLNTVRRRYDFANRFFNTEAVQGLGLPNPCDLIARPGKIVTSTIRMRRERVRTGAATPAPADVEPVDEIQPEASALVSTQEVVDRYMERRRLKSLAKATLDNYAYVLGMLADVSPTLPETEDDVYEVMGDPEYYKNGTRRQRYAALSAFHNSPIYKALGIPNPLTGVERPPKKATRKRTFDDEEIDALLAVATPQEAAFIRFGLDAGPRVGEATSITIGAIKDDEVEVKGKSDLRTIPIHLEIAVELRSLANAAGEIWYDERGRLNAEQLAKRFQQHAERAGITGEQIGPHTLRRTFATRWAKDGGNMAALQEVLGHADLATTMEYVDMKPEYVKRAHAEFSAAAQMGMVEGGKGTSLGSRSLGHGVFGVSALDAAMAKRLGAEELRTQAMVEYLAEQPCVERPNGRRPKILPREVAQMVILDL